MSHISCRQLPSYTSKLLHRRRWWWCIAGIYCRPGYTHMPHTCGPLHSGKSCSVCEKKTKQHFLKTGRPHRCVKEHLYIFTDVRLYESAIIIAIDERLTAQESHLLPYTSGRQGHWPLTGSHCRLEAPTGLHSHALQFFRLIASP